MAGQTNQFYNVTVTGFYCVVVSRNAYCSDTACIDHIPNGIDELSGNNWNIYPNPNNGSFTLSLDIQNEAIEMKVVNALGEIVDRRNFETKTGKQNFFISKNAARLSQPKFT